MNKRIIAFLCIVLVLSSLLLCGCKKEPGFKMVYGADPDALRVPNLSGLTLEEATDKLHELGLEVGEIYYQESGQKKDVVLRTDPLPGIGADKGAKVSLFLSTGKRQEKKALITVNWEDSDLEADEYILKVYVDGELQEHLGARVNGVFKQKNIYVAGSGEIDVTVKINDKITKKYHVNFDEDSPVTEVK